MALIDRVSARATATIERADPVTLEEFGALLARGGLGGGKTKSGVSVGPNEALGIPAWYSGCRAISEAVEFLPTSTYRQRLGGVKELRADPSWLRRPDVDTPWSALVELWIMSLLHRGNAYAFKIRNGAGQVVGLRPLLPSRVRVVDIVAGSKIFEVDGRKDIRYTTREILHIRGLSLDGVVGVDPITYHAETLGRVKGADDYASLYLGEGVHKTTYLSVPQDLNATQSTALAQQAKELWSGIQNAHQLGVIGNGGELKSLALNPEQLQLLESRRYGVIEVAMILRMPPHKLYELTRATFSNIEHQSIEWISDSVRPWVERVETWVNSDPDLLPAGNFIQADMEGLKRGDLASEMQAWSTGIQAGAVMPAEPRAKLGLPYLPGTRVFFRPLNVQVIDADSGDVLSDGSTASASQGGQP
jgi:HK97 family phage portal protein